MTLLPDEAQRAALTALEQDYRTVPIAFMPGDVVALVLPDGTEIVHPTEGGGYDVWGGGEPIRFGLSIDEARRVVQESLRASMYRALLDALDRTLP